MQETQKKEDNMGKKNRQLSEIEQHRLAVLKEYIVKAEWTGTADLNVAILDSRESDINGKDFPSDVSFAVLSGRNDNNINELNSLIISGGLEKANNIVKFNLASHYVILNLDTGEIVLDRKESMRPTREMLLKAIGREDLL